MKRTTITAEDIRRATRDPLMLKIIGGATKAAVYTDRRKRENKRACRGNWRDL